MNNCNWTAGPWFVDEYGDQVWIVDSEKNTAMAKIMHGRVDSEANAHLIAAAPELYEALDMLLHLHDAEVGVALPWNMSMEKARNVLAKARGEQQ